MTPHQLFLILRARYKLILTVLLMTVVAAMAVTFLLPPRYKASATVVVDFKIVDPITGTFLPVQLLLASYMATELGILESQTVALKVVKALHLADDEDTKNKFVESTEGKGSIENWIAAGLLSKLDVKPSKESR